MEYIRKYAFVTVVAAVFAFAAPALAGNTFWDDSTAGWLSGSSQSDSAGIASQPCDPAQLKKGGLWFLP